VIDGIDGNDGSDEIRQTLPILGPERTLGPMTNVSRREFVRLGGATAAALALPDRLLADPYAPLRRVSPRADVVRVRGRVHTSGRGLAGVAVTDGVSIVTTDRNGRYTLIADRAQPFVYLLLPAGYRIPVSAVGTAAFYASLGAGDEQRADFALEPTDVGDERHAFLLLADPQTQNMFEVARLNAETVPAVRSTVQGLSGLPLFGVACGDIMYDDLSLFPEYERAVAAMGIPFFQVVGNHDLVGTAPTDETANATFERHFGPAYYSFDHGEVHYVVLDDVFWHGRGYIGYLTQRQLDWLAADLARIERGRTVVVFLHIPVLSTQAQRNGAAQPSQSASVINREALYRLLEPYRAYALSGHTHEHEYHLDGGIRHHVHGTVCGAWWSGDICWDGTPNGYGVYEVSGSELRWRYQATGRPSEDQMRVLPQGSDPKAPDDVVANVWDADDRWTVVWYEGVDRRGTMGRRLAHDPVAVVQHTGPAKPPRREWVEPVVTGHLYYAPAAEGVEVRVEATDPWGRVYAATRRV
jgi:hypothetical protein